jgi:chromosome segregation ATPase
MAVSTNYESVRIYEKFMKKSSVKNSSKKKDQYTIVLEDLRGQFKVFGESLADVKRDVKAVKKRVDETFEEVGNIKVEITEIKSDITEIKGEIVEIKKRLDSIEKRLDRLEKNPRKTQSEIESLRQEGLELRLYSDDEEIQKRLNFFDKRIGRIEKQLKLSAA